MYVLYALLFLVVGGIEALLIRIQLFFPDNHFVSPRDIQPLFTMHGTTMIFFVAMPMVFGFANYLVPLMMGVRDMAFPRLNAFSFWMTAFGGLLLYYSFIGGVGLQGAGSAPDVGWLAYAPLTSKRFLARAHDRLLGAVALISRLRHRSARRSTSSPRILHALQGHDAVPHAAARLALSGDVRAGAARGQPAHRGADHAADRPLPGRALLRHPGRRLRGDLGALFLDLRPSRGLRAGDAGLRAS